MSQVKITETILRDAHQSLVATRMTMDEMKPALELLDKVVLHTKCYLLKCNVSSEAAKLSFETMTK